MRDQTAWSFSLGHWLGVPVRVHMLVVLFALCSSYLAWKASEWLPGTDSLTLVVSVAIGWAIALIVHDFGHAFVAANLGCNVRRFLVFPWGAQFEIPPTHGWNRFLIHLAGPGANLFAALVVAVSSIAMFDTRIEPSFFDPLRPDRLLESSSAWENAVRVTIWMNWFLALVNLTPAFLFDGGHLVLGLMQHLRPNSSQRQVLHNTTLITQFVGVSIVAVAVLVRAAGGNDIVPGWFGLLLFGCVLMFASRAYPSDLLQRGTTRFLVRSDLSSLTAVVTQRTAGDAAEQDGELGDDLDAAFDIQSGVDSEDEESLSTWLRERQLERVEQARRREADEERLADDILDKVHRSGMDSLSSDEKAILERVSQRYRSRQREQA